VLDAALAAGAPVEAVYAAPGAGDHPAAAAVLVRARESGVRVLELRAGVLERVADAATPQPVCAVVGFVDVALDTVLGRAPLLVCVDVRDPGNLGALVRVADAAGAGGVIACAGSADPYGPKTVRASAGSLFHVPLVTGGPAAEVLAALGSAGYRRLGTLARGGLDYVEADLSGRVALVFGNEASGLDPGTASLLDGAVTVPMAGRAESLNVAMTATVLCFEIDRRRRAGTEGVRR
jgi:TrmH family RNA methyltransferase